MSVFSGIANINNCRPARPPLGGYQEVRTIEDSTLTFIYFYGGAENAGRENHGREIDGPNDRTWECRNKIAGHKRSFHVLQFWWSVIFTSSIFSQPISISVSTVHYCFALLFIAFFAHCTCVLRFVFNNDINYHRWPALMCICLFYV